MGRYLAEIKKFESGGEPYLQNLQKSDFGSFVGFVGTPPPHFEKSQGTFVGFVGPPSPRFEKLQNHQAGPNVSVAQLPARLVTAARRVCREIHNDDDEAVQEMLADLCWNDPKDWENLIEHLEAQLPPDQAKPITLVTCSGCRHAEPSQHHPGIMHCKAGVASGAATGGWQATDEHLCDKREDHHA